MRRSRWTPTTSASLLQRISIALLVADILLVVEGQYSCSPYPHFGYTLALKHSPQLRNVPTLPRGGDDLGDGVSSL